jgi:hypothetical protein
MTILLMELQETLLCDVACIALGTRETLREPVLPTPQIEMAPPNDTVTVYAGHDESPFAHRPMAWRYSNKNALHSPDVPAVSEFRKAVEFAGKPQPKAKS